MFEDKTIRPRCLSEDTKILSGEQWKGYQELKVGDPVLAFDISTGDFQEEAVEEVIIFAYDDDAFHIFGEGIDCLVSLGHRVIISGADAQPEFVLAENLPQEIHVPMVTFLNEDFFFPEYVPANVKKTRFTGIVWCVKVPSGAVLAKRKDLAFITGNSL